MVGIKKFKFILGIIIYFLSFFIMSQNTFAVNIQTVTRGDVYRQLNGGTAGIATFLNGNSSLPVTILNVSSSINSYYASGIEVTSNIPNPTEGKFFEVTLTGAIGHNYGSFNSTNCNGLAGTISFGIDGTAPYNKTISCELSDNNTVLNFQIFEYLELPSTSTPNKLIFTLYNPSNYLFSCSNNSQSMAYPCVAGSSYRITYLDLKLNSSADPNLALLQQQINQNQIMINQNQTIIQQNDYMAQNDEEYYDRQYQANDNIANQSADDIQGTSDQKTDSLIGVITGFLNAFSNINATNCNLTLTFPEYAGGTRVVNICSGKDKAPRIVEIGSSLLLILVFVPLAFIMLRLIYNEIRSWTNG